MPYRVEIVSTESNNRVLENLPKEILPKIAVHIKRLSENPYLGRSVEGPITAYIYSFSVNHINRVYGFSVSYKINENKETIVITEFGKTITNYLDT